MVCVAREVFYGRADLVQQIKPDRCEPLIVNGAAQRVCVSDEQDPVAASDQNLAQIRAMLLKKYVLLTPEGCIKLLPSSEVFKRQRSRRPIHTP